MGVGGWTGEGICVQVYPRGTDDSGLQVIYVVGWKFVRSLLLHVADASSTLITTKILLKPKCIRKQQELESSQSLRGLIEIMPFGGLLAGVKFFAVGGLQLLLGFKYFSYPFIDAPHRCSPHRAAAKRKWR